MPYYSDSQIAAANRADLAAYLMSHGETLRRAGRQYVWERGKVWIDGCRWYSHYDREGGYAIRFVMKYFGLPFREAAARLLGEKQTTVLPPEPKRKAELTLPVPASSNDRVLTYLTEQRCLSEEVVGFFMKRGQLYEEAERHNCVFVGLDDDGAPAHVHLRGTSASFRQTLSGSRAEYALWVFR